ncbi:MAG: helix-turn-helix transcriptional regulator [Chitinophagaceae bacterium]|nr:helix-turn-helix transcriptional regulator [Chitinophagaceae bacterium]MBP8244122.1 helix-turn-helix transcriptional regulator [Chitinophagaceae bacterium]
MLIGGHNNKQIGDRLFLSELTIKTHRKNIMKKMDAHNPADLLQKSKGPSSKF